MLREQGYLERYVAHWSERPEVDRIWVSLYTPQIGEQSVEMITPDNRKTLARELPQLSKRFPKLLMNEGIAQAFLKPPKDPSDCVFSKMSANYSADLESRVEPCVFGGTPDCSQCGCAISSGLHWVRTVPVAGPLKVDHFIGASVKTGLFVNRLRKHAPKASPMESKVRAGAKQGHSDDELVQIDR